jgi:hypothetical protein
MKKTEVEYWRGAIENSALYMRDRHKVWKRLLRAYEMDFEVGSLPDDKIVRVSRFYPLTRQIIASISFNHPHVFFSVKEPNKEFAATILERVANAALEQMNAKAEVQQVIFDALYCAVGWLKCGYNPPGDDDLVAPYTVNDALDNDFPYIHRINPFNVFIDPLTPPHKLSHARYIIEKMLVPLEYVKKDDRFVNRRQIQAAETEEDIKDTFLQDIGGAETTSEKEALNLSKSQGQMTVLYEIHDRMKRRRYTFAPGVEEPIEDVEHPMRAMKPIYAPDPFTGELLMTGEYEAEGGFLVQGGFPYIPLKFDQTQKGFYGQPPMAYGEDLQKLIVESVSRRADLLKRYPRVLLASRRERDNNADIGQQLETGRDGEVIWVDDVNQSFKELGFGNPPPDQLGIESDARSYEEQAMGVSQMALGGGPKVTATQASLTASFGQLNREWLQDRVKNVYGDIVRNSLRMMADIRYLPEEFLINVATDENEPVYEAVTTDMLRVRYAVDIEAGSMSPLTEQLEREDALALFNYTIQLPEVDRGEAIKGLLKAFKVQDPDKYFKPGMEADVMKLASMENLLYLLKGAMIDAGPDENHQVHLQIHSQIQQMPEFQQLLPVQQQQILQIAQAHMQQHQQFLAQKAQGQAPGQGGGEESGGRIPGIRERAGTEGGGGIVSLVRSNAQEMSQQVQRAPGQG